MKKYNYGTDGIIFTNIKKNYNDSIHYKWKPPEHLTIDFVYIAVDTSYMLCSGINRKMFKQLGLFLPDKFLQNAKQWIQTDGRELFSEFFPVPFMPSMYPKAYNAPIKNIPANTITEHNIHANCFPKPVAFEIYSIL